MSRAGSSARLTAVLEHLPPDRQGSFALLVVGTDGAGKSEMLDALVEAINDADRPVVRLRGRRLETGETFGALVAGLPGQIDQSTAGESEARALLLDQLGRDGVLVVDDAHWLDPATARVVAGVAERVGELGLGLIVARRTGPGPAELGALDLAVSRLGRTVTLEPLSLADAAERVARTLDAPADDALVDALVERTAGRQFLVDLLLDSWRAERFLDRGALAAAPGDVSADVVERLRPRIEQLDSDDRAVLESLSLGAALDDELLAAVAGVDPTTLGASMVALDGAGFLLAGKEEVVPMAAEVVAALVPDAERRRFHTRLLESMGDRSMAPGVRAEHLYSSGVVGDEVARSFLEAGDAELAQAPDLALVWYDRAAEVGAGPDAVGARRAIVVALAGDPLEAARLADAALGAGGDDAERARPVVAAAAVASLQPDRGADLLLGAESLELRLGAGPALLSLGQLARLRTLGEEVRTAGGAERAAAVESGLAVDDGLISLVEDDAAASLAHLSRGAQLAEAAGTGRVLGDSPHALGAVVALLSLDFPAAEHLLRRAVDHEVGGTFLRTRHHLLLAWCSLRTGQWALAEATVAATEGDGLFPRDELVLRALEAGLARRSGDVAGLAAAWKRAEAALLRAPADLFALEMLGEIGIAAGRLDLYDRVTGQVAQLDALIDAFGSPSTLKVPALWNGVQRAVANDDAQEVARLTGQMATVVPTVVRHRVLIDAAAMWVLVLDRSFAPDELEQVAAALADVGLVWEASRLTGQAAIRSTDASVTRALLGRAREMIDAVPSSEAGDESVTSTLSERERDVARLVVDGLTYKEIGAQLYISPKTVEHHVAKIRQKLGASTRAEMLAALKSELV